MEEKEVEVSDFSEMQDILENLGMEVVLRLSKHRTSYCCDGIHFEIDRYEDIPAFLEIEAPDIEALEKNVRMLGFSMEQTRPWTGKQLMEHYRQK